MKPTGRIEIFNGISIHIPNDTFNLKDEGCYVSYNSHTRHYGCDTTALVREDGVNPTKFLILNGNHMKEYLELGNYQDCVEYFKNHSEQQNKYSENWDEEIIIDLDGKLHVRKLQITE